MNASYRLLAIALALGVASLDATALADDRSVARRARRGRRGDGPGAELQGHQQLAEFQLR